MFPGGGAQYPNMGRDLYQQEKVYRDEIDRGLKVLSSKVDYDLKPLLFPEPGDEEKAGAELQLGSRSLPAASPQDSSTNSGSSAVSTSALDQRPVRCQRGFRQIRR